jgi:hypothetical protein
MILTASEPALNLPCIARLASRRSDLVADIRGGHNVL